MAAIGAAHRPADERSIGLEVVGGHDPAGGLHGGRDLLRDRALVERARAVCANRFQRVGEVALHERVAGAERFAVRLEENLRRRRPARHARAGARQQVGGVVLDREAVAGERDRGRDQLGEREAAGAVAAVGQREARHRARHADAERGKARQLRIGVALLVEEHGARRRRRRGLAVVDGDLAKLALGVGEMDHHVAAAADVAGARIGHRHGEAGGDRGVHRVAAALEHIDADARGARLLRHHHAVLVRLDLRGGGRRRGEQGKERAAGRSRRDIVSFAGVTGFDRRGRCEGSAS